MRSEHTHKHHDDDKKKEEHTVAKKKKKEFKRNDRIDFFVSLVEKLY